MLDPRMAFQLGAQIRHLTPRLRPSHLHTVQRAFAHHISAARGSGYPTWQDAWNDFIGTRHPQQTGTLHFTTDRCPDCPGRGMPATRNISRNISRTGSPYICGTCRGSGRGQRLSLPAKHATPSHQPTHPQTGDQA